MRLDNAEMQLLRLISEEMEQDEIAIEMELSIKEINEMIERIMIKFETKTEVGLVKTAIKKGIIQND